MGLRSSFPINRDSLKSGSHKGEFDCSFYRNQVVPPLSSERYVTRFNCELGTALIVEAAVFDSEMLSGGKTVPDWLDWMGTLLGRDVGVDEAGIVPFGFVGFRFVEFWVGLEERDRFAFSVEHDDPKSSVRRYRKYARLIGTLSPFTPALFPSDFQNF